MYFDDKSAPGEVGAVELWPGSILTFYNSHKKNIINFQNKFPLFNKKHQPYTLKQALQL